MEKDCLVTKLKGEVKANLPRLGEISFTYNSAGINVLKGSCLDSACDLMEDGNYVFTLPSYDSQYTNFAAGVHHLTITNKYKIVSFPNLLRQSNIDLREFDFCVSLQSLNLNNSGAKGDIKYLGRSTHLTTLSCYNCTEIYGSIEGLAEIQVLNGRTSGSLALNDINRCRITYNGQVVTDVVKTITFSASGYTVS